MNEVEKKVLYKFVELLEKHRNGDISFLWVQAGGKIASQQSVQSDDCPSCAGSGKKEIGGMLLTCLACDGTGNRR